MMSLGICLEWKKKCCFEQGSRQQKYGRNLVTDERDVELVDLRGRTLIDLWLMVKSEMIFRENVKTICEQHP